jgi:hypothetical protein
MIEDIKGNSEKLRALRDTRKTNEAEAFVSQMLTDSREGLQSGALQVLGSWGEREDKKRIVEFLIAKHTPRNRHKFALRGVAIRALQPLIVPDDAPWLLDLCFAQTELPDRHALFSLFARLTPETTRTYLVSKLSGSAALDRWAAARAIMAIPFPDRKKLLTVLLTDRDRLVRETAGAGIAQSER